MVGNRKATNGLFLIIFMVYILMLCTLFVYISSPRIMGNVIAQGGQATELTINQRQNTLLWYGFYGNLSTSGASNLTFYGGGVTYIEIYSADVSNTDIVYASMSDDIDWSLVTNASPSEVDAFLGVLPDDPVSGTNVFTGTLTYEIEGSNITTHSTTTRSLSGTYDLGILKFNGTLIFVSHIVNGISFDNTYVDFQFMVPIPSGANMTYYFGPYVHSDQPINCTSLTGLNITIAENSSVTLSWPQVPGASGYKVYHIDALVDLMFDFSNATVEAVSGNAWSDADPGTRYYRVSSVNPGGECFFNMTAGRFEHELYKGWNLISSPLIFANDSVKDALKTIDGKYTNVNEFDNSDQVYNYYIISGSTIFSNFDTIKPGYAYWVKLNSNSTLATAGRVYHNIAYPLAFEWSLVGFPVVTFNDTVSYVLNQVSGKYTNVNEFDNQKQAYNYYIVSGTTIFSNFNTVKPGRGYWIKVKNNITFNYTNEPYT